MRVVVTGGAGFIGVHSVAALIDSGDTVLVIDDLRHRSSLLLPAAADVAECDVATQEARDSVARFRPDAVLHLAAQGGVNRSWRDPVADARCNVLGTVSMLRAAAEVEATRFVFASSGGALYGDAARLPSGEDDPVAPRSPYGTAKLAAEAYVRLFTSNARMTGCAVRYGNVYGPGQDGSGEAGLAAITCRRLLRGERPEIRGDGAQTRDFVFGPDVAAANANALCSTATGAWNIGTGAETAVRDVVATLIGAAGAAVEPVHVAGVPDEVRRSCLDVSRAARELGWRAATPLVSGLNATFESFRVEQES